MDKDEVIFSAEKIISSANILKVVISTTGTRGGDAGHGGYACLEFFDEASTSMSVETDKTPTEFVEHIKLSFCGDTEIETFRDALLFAAQQLDRMLR